MAQVRPGRTAQGKGKGFGFKQRFRRGAAERRHLPNTGREDGLARAADISSTNLAAASFHKTDSRARDTWVHAGTAER
jgi:hypothetical protein